MAVDKNRVIAEATKLVQKGQFDKAIKAYERILAEDGKDVRILLKVGELQQKKGDNPAAAESFSRVADAYGEQGFFLKAVAVYKQMMKLAPEDVRVNERLAGLYQQLGILSDAMGQLQLVAAAAEKAGDQPKLLDVLRRMVELDPDNVGSAVKLGELYAKTSQTKLALDHLRRAAEQLKRNNRAEEYLKVAERIAFLGPEDVALTRELANIYLAKGDTKRALAKLQLCFKANPKDVETLTLLAQAFKDLGQVSKTVSVYKELAHLYAENGRADEGRATWRRVLELAPDDEEAAQAERARPSPLPAATAPTPIATARMPAPGPPPGARRAAPLTPTPTPARVPAPSAPPATVSVAAAVAAAPAPRAAGPEAIPKLLTETDVYMKYGLHEKALEHLKKVFAIDPDHLDAREKAMQLRALRNDAAGAAEEAVKAARIALARGLEDRARASVARLRELAPGHPELAALGGAAHAAVEEEVLVEPDEELVLEVEPLTSGEADDIALAAAGVPIEEIVEEEPADEAPELRLREETETPAGAQRPAAAAARPLPPAPPVVVPPPPRVTAQRPGPGPGIGIGPRPGPPGPAAVQAPPPAPPLIVAPPPPLTAQGSGPRPGPPPAPPAVRTPPRAPPVVVPPPVPAEGPGPRPRPAGLAPTQSPPPAPPPAVVAAPQPRLVVPAPPIALQGSPSRATPAPAAARPPPAPPPAPPVVKEEQKEEQEEEDLDDELEEADFFIQQGLLDDARESLQNLLAFYPDHAKLKAKVAELERKAAPPPPPSPAAPVAAAAAAGEESFDIARELADELGSASAAPEAADEFKYSVEDVFSQFKKGVAETVKAEDSETHYDLGIAYKEMGLLDDAIHEFEVALAGKGRKKEVDCLTMIGLCRMEKDDAAGAVQAYQRALRSDYLAPEVGRAVHYEIACAYEKAGDPEAALHYLHKVLKVDAGYRDAKTITDRLGGGPGRAPAGVEAARPVQGEASTAGAPRNGPKKNIGYV